MGRILSTTVRNAETQALIDSLRKKIVGQEAAIDALVDIVEGYKAGFTDPDRPAGNALFLGPTGSGKTRTVEALCEGLFGNGRAMIKVNCGEYIHGHEIAKLVGSPPGYLGHRETQPMLTQEALAQFHTEKLKLSVVLFDEIEKSSDTLWTLLLGILDKAKLSLGDNRVVDFSKVIVVLTSNLGSKQITDAMEGGLGFVPDVVSDEVLDAKIDTVTVDAAKKKFTPEFFNRIDHIAVFHPLTEEHMKKILDIEIGMLQYRLVVNCAVKFFFNVAPSAKKILLTEGYDKKYGARHLKRAIERRLQTPLAKLVASGQIMERDRITVRDVGKPEFEFIVEDEVILGSGGRFL